jgi:phosphomevalonate kinase
MTERRQQLIVDRDELREIMLEVMSSKLTLHSCRLSEEERMALKELSVFLQRIEKTKWAFMLVMATTIAVAACSALWLGIKQMIKGQG